MSEESLIDRFYKFCVDLGEMGNGIWIKKFDEKKCVQIMTWDYDLFCYDENGPFTKFDRRGRICVRLHEPSKVEIIPNACYLDTYTWGDVLDDTPHNMECGIIGELVFLKNLCKGRKLMNYGKFIILTSISGKIFTRTEWAWDDVSIGKLRNPEYIYTNPATHEIYDYEYRETAHVDDCEPLEESIYKKYMVK